MIKSLTIERRNKAVSQVKQSLTYIANKYDGNMELIIQDMRDILPHEIKLGYGGHHIWATNSKNERLFIVEGY